MHSAKGLEFSHVFVGAVDAFDEAREPIAEELRLLYVAMTRATLWLALSARRSTPLVENVREHLDRLQAEWAKLD